MLLVHCASCYFKQNNTSIEKLSFLVHDMRLSLMFLHFIRIMTINYSRLCPAVIPGVIVVLLMDWHLSLRLKSVWFPTRVGCVICLYDRFSSIACVYLDFLPSWVLFETIVVDNELFRPCSEHPSAGRYNCDAQWKCLQCRNYDCCLPGGSIERCVCLICFSYLF